MAAGQHAQLYRELAKIGKSLASDRRLEIMDLLAQSPKTVATLAQQTGMSIANTSRHLQALREANLVGRVQRGNYAIYCLASAQVEQLFYLLRDVGEAQLPTMQTIQRHDDTVKRIQTLDLSTALKLMDRDDVQLLDVRPAEEFQVGHIDGAYNIPVDELSDRLTEIPADQELIVYCRGPLCSLTNHATQWLRQRGRQAYSLHASYYDWQVAVTG